MKELNFKEFLKELNENTIEFRKATFVYEDEMLAYLNIELDFFDNMSIKEIRVYFIRT